MIPEHRIWKLVSISTQLKEYHQVTKESYKRNKRTLKTELHGQDVSHDIANIMVTNPVTLKENSLGEVIISLNDNHQWSREAIADWLDTLDNQPTFYPAIEKTEITKEESSAFIRKMPYGTASMEIKYACGCHALQTSRTPTCGICWENRRDKPFGTFLDGFTHDCRKHWD